MLYRKLPGTDIELSVVGFGCWGISGRDWGDDVDDDRSIAALRAALDHGINWFDTAPIYGHGHADELLLRALGPERLRSEEVIVATKVGVRLDRATGHAHSDLSPEHIASDAEASLTRLGLARIDLLQVHWPCERGTPLPETIGALERLVDQGKIRHWGLCNYDEAAVRAAAAVRAPVSLQTPLSMVRRELEGGLGFACAELGVGVLAYETLCRGLLTGKFRQLPRFPDSDLRSKDPRFWGTSYLRARALVEALAQAAARINLPPAALAIGWAATRPGVVAAIVGAKTAEQVRSNVRVARALPHERLWSVVERIADTYG